jgi:hypothetical protein
MDNRHLVWSRSNLWAAVARVLGVTPADGPRKGGARAAPAPMRSLKRRLYGLAFTVARFLVVEKGRGAPLHRKTRRREAVLSLGGPAQRPSRTRGSRRSRGSHGCSRRK